MMWRILACLSILVFAQALRAQDNLAEADPHHEIKAMMISAIRGEVREIYRNELDLQVLDYSKHLQLEQPTLDRLTQLAEAIARQKEEAFSDSEIEKVLQKKVQDFEGIESFRVNGKLHALEGSQKEPFVLIKVGNVQGRIFLSMKTGIASMVAQADIDPKPIQEWREILAGVHDEQLEAFRQDAMDRRTKRLLRWVELVLIDELRATEEQVLPLREWLESHIDSSNSESIYFQAKREITGLKFELPECFSEAQNDAFRHLKALYNR